MSEKKLDKKNLSKTLARMRASIGVSLAGYSLLNEGKLIIIEQLAEEFNIDYSSDIEWSDSTSQA